MMTTIATYLDSLPAHRRETLTLVHRCIAKALPRMTTDMATGMPTFHLNGHPVFALADRKNFMVFHVVHYDLLSVFKHELMKHDHGRSCIRFTRPDPDLLHLLDKVVKYCGEQMQRSIHYGRPHKLRGHLKRPS